MGSFQELLTRIKNGEEVPPEVYDQVFEKMSRYLSTSISNGLQSKISASAIAQSAFRSWWSEVRNGRLSPNLSSDEEVNALYNIARKKLSSTFLYWERLKRDYRLEKSGDEEKIESGHPEDSPELNAIGNELAKTVIECIEMQPAKRHEALTLRLVSGYTTAETLDKLAKQGILIAPRTIQLWVENCISLLKEKWEIDEAILNSSTTDSEI